MRSSEVGSHSPEITSTKGILLYLVDMDRAADACTRLCEKNRARTHHAGRPLGRSSHAVRRVDIPSL